MLQLDKLLTTLDDANVQFVVIGGIAAIAQGVTYYTEDFDICYSRTPDNLQKLSEALQPLSPYLRGAPEGLPFTLDVAMLQSGLNFTLVTDFGDVDLLGEVSGLGQFEQVKANAERVEYEGFDVWVLTLEGLAAAKRASGRPKDLRLLPEIEVLLLERNQSKGNK